MPAIEVTLRVLRERGDWWQAAPGLIGLRGAAHALYRHIERLVAAIALEETDDEWLVPAALPLETLARADYFASFPQWLTVASHLTDDVRVLERVASDADPASAARTAVAPAKAALSPAICYHTYAALTGTMVGRERLMTAQGTCWRHEGERLMPLERGWAFTMREIVCLGTPDATEAFRQRGMRHAVALAAALGLDGEIAAATDPFFAPTSRGKSLLQRVKALKHEMVLPIAGERGIAAASFNHHETFFGEAFDIRLEDGSPASTACVAFGIERWLLAVLAAHGPSPSDWPSTTETLAVHAEA